MTVIPKETAEKEINSWLDYKRIKAPKREENQKIIDALVSDIQNGYLEFDEESMEFTYKLQFPLNAEGGNGIDRLTFVPRLTGADLEPYLKNAKAGDSDGRLRAYICALTKQPTAIIKKLDTCDMETCTNIALFFI